MFYQLFHTAPGIAPLCLRLGLAVCIFPHGAQKAMGWFDGSGFSVAMEYFSDTLGAPYIFGLLVIGFEFVGTIGLVLGVFTRIWALGIGIILTVAAATHVKFGFFMNWFGDKGGEGFEYHILAVSMALALFFFGGGSFSIDKKLGELSV